MRNKKTEIVAVESSSYKTHEEPCYAKFIYTVIWKSEHLWGDKKNESSIVTIKFN